jgi:arginyl-tRNA synthetase
MCDNNTKAIEMWKKLRELSITRYEKFYARLNIRFDEYAGESSEYAGESKVKESMATVEKMVESGLTEPSNGATIVDFSKHVPW